MHKKSILHLFVIFSLLFAILSVRADTGIIDINSATVEQLAELKGIGKKKAQRIIEYREQFGDFESVTDLAKVKGIGVKTVDKNFDVLRVKSQQ